MLTAVLVVVRQVPCQRGWHAFIPTLPIFRYSLKLCVVFADHKLMLQRYVCGETPTHLSTQTTHTPYPATNSTDVPMAPAVLLVVVRPLLRYVPMLPGLLVIFVGLYLFIVPLAILMVSA